MIIYMICAVVYGTGTYVWELMDWGKPASSELAIGVVRSVAVRIELQFTSLLKNNKRYFSKRHTLPVPKQPAQSAGFVKLNVKKNVKQEGVQCQEPTAQRAPPRRTQPAKRARSARVTRRPQRATRAQAWRWQQLPHLQEGHVHDRGEGVWRRWSSHRHRREFRSRRDRLLILV